MERGALSGNPEIAVAVGGARHYTHTEFEQVPDAVGVPITREFGQEFATLGPQLADGFRPAFRRGPRASDILGGAGRNQAPHALKLERYSTLLEQPEQVPTPPPDRRAGMVPR